MPTEDQPDINQRKQSRSRTGLFSNTVRQLQGNLLTSNNVAINLKRRKIPLTFLPPSTKSPLFIYNNDFDQRSFLSLCSGSHLDDGSVINDRDIADNESVSTFRSLPSTLEVNDDEIESIHQWLDEERERRSLLSGDEGFEGYGAASINSAHNRNAIRENLNNNDDILRLANKLFPENHANSRTYSFISVEDVIKDEQEEDFESEVPTIKNEVYKLASYSVPLIITFFLEQIFSLVCVVFVGHLGKEELAAVSMASMTSTIVLAIFEGIATSLDTLCPQAYGAGHPKHVGIHTQRCCYFSLVMFIPAAIFWYFSGYFLSLILKDQKVIHLTQNFLRVLVLGGPPYILFENGKRFLQAQGIFDAGTYILFITAPLNICLNWLLVYSDTFGLGYIGAPIASVINFWAMFILLVLYIVYIDGLECWGGFTTEAFNHWYDLSKLAIPGIIMLLAESLAYEILTLFASKFGTSALATQSALSSVVSLLYMIPFAISVASSTRIANFIGSGNVKGATTAINVAFLSSLLIAGINFATIYFASGIIARLFTEDDEVIQLFVKLCPIISIFVIFDSVACVANGVLRALAMQMIGGALSLLGYYVIAVPLALFLGFSEEMNILGLWLGNGTGLLFIGLVEICIIYTANWDNILAKSKKIAVYETI